MKAVVTDFNQELALVGAFSVITNLRMEALSSTRCNSVLDVAAGHQMVVSHATGTFFWRPDLENGEYLGPGAYLLFAGVQPLHHPTASCSSQVISKYFYFTPSKYFYVTLLLLTCEDPVHVRAPLGGLLLPPVLVGGCPGGGGGDLEAVLYQALVTSSCAEVARSSSHTDLARDARQLPPRQPRLHGHQHAAAALKMTLQQLDGADERHSLACDSIVLWLILNGR